VIWQLACARWFCAAGAVEKANGVGLQLDDKLLDDVVDRFLTAGHLDRAIVFAGSEFALYEDMCAFAEAGCQLRNPFPYATTLCHWVLSFHSPLSSFQERVVATENLVTGVPFGICLVSAFLPMKPIIVS
jgi:hypothetical protein